jgi:RHS repeat-associated protein
VITLCVSGWYSGRLLADDSTMTWVTTYNLYDGLGSTTTLIGASEAIQATYSYDAFGGIRTNDQYMTPFLYVGASGYYYDPLINSYYLRARDYVTTFARFIAIDELWPDVAGAYNYVENNPVMSVDPSGHHTWKHSAKGEPKLGCDDSDVKEGFELKVQQEFNGAKPKLTFPKGSQVWQINTVTTLAVIWDGKQCIEEPAKEKRTEIRLDVTDIGGKTTPLTFTDTVGLTPSSKGSVCMLLHAGKKELGFRPHVPGTFAPLGASLPTGVNFIPKAVDLANAQKNIAEPKLTVGGKPVTFKFLYVNKQACCLCSTKMQRYVDSLLVSRAIGGPSLGDVDGVQKSLQYGDFGTWFSACGPSTTLPCPRAKEGAAP